MPELPEVETICKRLAPVLIGKTIQNIEVLREKSLQGLSTSIIGKKIVEVSRKAKLLDIKLSDSSHLLIHLKMTGQLIYQDQLQRLGGGHPTADWVDSLPSKHTRVIFRLSNHSTLFFNDMRVFGWIKHLSEEGASVEFSRYGPDIIDPAVTLEYIFSRFSKTSRPIKVVIMDSSIIAGVGNIYANDALNLAKIHPNKPANSLTQNETKELLDAMIEVINLGIKHGGATIGNFRNIDGFSGNYQTKVLVYQRENLACFNCAGIIKKTKIGGRGTFYCPNCQV
ncbi:MAG: hypothetical protein COY80_04155 [Candidatus Pacebacteria bacterium CG_4_10_14_0_8_um_filter_42_14]|nr:MAG: hypothetical protein COY80_04155 [Candidatus Pacebacteria bacterium CG_4_10_14_0_8_um_filter_42_14]